MAPKHVFLVAVAVFVGCSALHHERVKPNKNRHAQVASALRKTSLVDAAEALTNSSYTLAYCVRIITDTGDHQNGYLAVQIDGVEVVPSTYFAKGSTVLQQCYATVPTIGISNPTSNRWGGAIEISTDGGTTYESMTCLDCLTATKDTSYIFADGDGTGASDPTTGCVGSGNVCTVSLWGSGSYCVRIITEDYSSQQGDLVVEVDGLKVRDGFFNQGDTVLDQCYLAAPTIKLNNPTNDGWGGNVLASINGGADYSSMICADCISGSDTSYMVVKADGQSSSDTVCSGTTFFCTLHWNTVAPTPAPTSSPTTAAPTVSPTSSPTTAAPTASPTAATVPTTVGLTGDPHVTNLVGKRFDVHYAGNIMLLQVPRGAEEGSTLLRLDGHTKQVGDVCNNQLYLDVINITGRWSMASNDAPVSIKAKKKAAAAGHPKHKQRFHFGGVLIVLSHAHTDTGITYMNLRVSNLARLKMPVGGLLGEDDYSWAYAMPVECQAAEGEKLGHEGADSGKISLISLGTKL